MESRMRMRRRPLDICGKSVLATANRAYTKVQESAILSGAFMKLPEKSMCIARLIFCTLQYYCLAIVSAMDSWILSAETTVERIFPSSAYVFNMVDELVKISESFPERCDGVLAWTISWLEISVLAISRWESKSTSEKEIRVDDTGHDDRLKIPDHTKRYVDAVGHASKGITKVDNGEDQTRDEETCKKRKEGGDDEIRVDDTGHSDRLKSSDHTKGDADVVGHASKGTTKEVDIGEDQTWDEEKSKEGGGDEIRVGDTSHYDRLKIPDHTKGDADMVDHASMGTTVDNGEDQTKDEETCKKRKEGGGGGKSKRGKKKD